MVMVGLKLGTALIECDGMAEVADSSIRARKREGVWNQPDGADSIPTKY
jgi:hypothetical protein